jgi:hypothetical protein
MILNWDFPRSGVRFWVRMSLGAVTQLNQLAKQVERPKHFRRQSMRDIVSSETLVGKSMNRGKTTLRACTSAASFYSLSNKIYFCSHMDLQYFLLI